MDYAGVTGGIAVPPTSDVSPREGPPFHPDLRPRTRDAATGVSALHGVHAIEEVRHVFCHDRCIIVSEKFVFMLVLWLRWEVFLFLLKREQKVYVSALDE